MHAWIKTMQRETAAPPPFASMEIWASSMLRFLKHLETQRQSSPLTLKSYAEDMSTFEMFLTESVSQTRLASGPGIIDIKDLRRYGPWLSGVGLSARTIARKLASLRSCFRYLRRQGMIAIKPAEALKNPKQPKRLPAPLGES